MIRKPPLTNKRWAIALRIGWLVPIGFALGSLLLSSPLGSMRSPLSAASPIPAPTPLCISDQDCSDNVFCNGIERCGDLSWAGADSRGCVASAGPPCRAGQQCEEDRDRCVRPCADADNDGHQASGCGGDDCDDHDPTRYPGRQEVCDAEGHDEDCDPTTHGHRDVDRDSEDDIRCCNRAASGALRCGTDYDDNNPAVRVGSMICDGSDAVVVSGSKSLPCPTGTKCLPQPNGTGICIVPSADYVPPPRFEPPPQPAQREALPTLATLISPGNAALINPVVAVPKSAEQTSDSADSAVKAKAAGLTNVMTEKPAATDTTGGFAAEVEECKSTLRSGKVSWGGGTSWAAGNIERLCNGTKNARETIACFQKNVEALGWEVAIDKCR